MASYCSATLRCKNSFKSMHGGGSSFSLKTQSQRALPRIALQPTAKEIPRFFRAIVAGGGCA